MEMRQPFGAAESPVQPERRRVTNGDRDWYNATQAPRCRGAATSDWYTGTLVLRSQSALGEDAAEVHLHKLEAAWMSAPMQKSAPRQDGHLAA